ncbi:MAG: hypothetical protein E6Q97_29155 [Desulfurellales bacterium]|nr:MAG: hypothetical protein E6Q97_29155 [Desulfurellales bacterium]
MNCIVTAQTAAYLAAQDQYAAEDRAIADLADDDMAIQSAVENVLYGTHGSEIDQIITLLYRGNVEAAVALFNTAVKPAIADEAVDYAAVWFQNAMRAGGM